MHKVISAIILFLSNLPACVYSSVDLELLYNEAIDSLAQSTRPTDDIFDYTKRAWRVRLRTKEGQNKRYWSTSGKLTFYDSDTFIYGNTYPIHLNQGEKITFTAFGSDRVSVLSLMDGENFVSSLIAGELKKNTYTYVADRDCDVVISSLVDALPESVDLETSVMIDMQKDIDFLKSTSPNVVSPSAYDSMIEEYDCHIKPSVEIKGLVSPSVINIDTNNISQMSSLILNKIGEGVSDILVNIQSGIYHVSDNLLNLTGISNPNVKIKIQGNGAKFIPYVRKYDNENVVGYDGCGRIFDYEADFNFFRIFADEEGNIIRTSYNYGNGTYLFDGDITLVSSSGKKRTYKAKVAKRFAVGNDVVGKLIQFSSWYNTIFATITNVSETNEFTYLTFETTFEDSFELEVNSDRRFGLNACFKIHNLKAEGLGNSYYIADGKIHLPSNEIIYECGDKSFNIISIKNCSCTVIVSGISFIGGSKDSNSIYIENSSNIAITGNTFNAVGTGLYCTDVHNCMVSNNNVFDSRSAFVFMNVFDGIVTHNYLKGIGIYWEDHWGIRFNLGHWLCSNNKIEDFEYTSILAKTRVFVPGGTKTEDPSQDISDYYGIIEYNDISIKDWNEEYQGHQLIDCGAIGPSTINYPVFTRYNIVRDYLTRHSGSGIMLGGNCSQQKIYGNLFVGKSSFYGIYIYAGAEYSTKYPNGVENFVCYNISQHPIMMIGGTDYDGSAGRDYSSVYHKTDNDCHLGRNIIGLRNAGVDGSVLRNIAYQEEQTIDTHIQSIQNGTYINYDVKSWQLPYKIKQLIIQR